MRLLVVTTVAGTIRAFLLPFVQHFRSLGWQVDGMAAGIKDCTTCAATFNDLYEVPWSRSPVRNLALFSNIKRVRKVIARGRYDIIHVHTPVAAFITRAAIAFLPKLKRPRVIYTAHGFHFQAGNFWLTNLIYTTLEKIVSRWTDYLITINDTDSLAANRLRLVPLDRLWPMPGIGVNRRYFSPSSPSKAAACSIRRRFEIGQDVPLFVMIAEFLPRKRHADMIAALERMRRADAAVIFVGEGASLPAIRRVAQNSPARGRIFFAGAQSDVRPYIFAARATVLTSSQEGLPRSIMESLCCGVPVVGSDVRGICDLLAGGFGTLHACGDVEALARELDWFVDNPDAAIELGRRGCEQMALYDIEHVIHLHDELYATALGKPLTRSERTDQFRTAS
jgi:glycosyltransferase involved in cell wall biosynthesis